MRIFRWIGAAAISSVVGVNAPSAQTIEAISFGAGIASEGMWESNEAVVLDFRVEMPWSRMLLLEPRLAFARGNLDGEGGATLLVPELQAQVQLPLGGAALYAGAGMGMAFAWRSDGNGGFAADAAPSLAAGLRVDYGGLLGFVVDGRVRGTGLDFDERSHEITVGVRLRR